MGEIARRRGQSLSAAATAPTGTAQAEVQQVLQRAYTYRADGHLTAIDDSHTGRRTFDLDRAGRVTAVHATDWSEAYAYAAPNPVTYVHNPLSYIDPLGLSGCSASKPGTHLGDTGRLGGWIPEKVPDEAMEAISDVKKYGRDATGWGEQWHGPNLSMETFQNTGKGGAHALPTHSSSGEPIRYREYGAPASPDNPKPGGERIVFGSDGSIYYSPTHYQTYIVVEGPKR
ncbi:ribonuclease domain-containing protein [Streptomyces sp. DB-54]